MHSVIFFPLGNADSCRIDLENGKKLLIDYADVANPEDKTDLRVNLAAMLRSDLNAAKRDAFDVVAFTHVDNDHVHGAADFFYLEHAAKYQGEGRIKINELWVPASLILESDLDGDARVLRQEARYRLKNGQGIRVFSRPEALKAWLEGEGLTLDVRRPLITDAGQLIPGFTKAEDGVEFFVHSPFARRVNDTLDDRNNNSLVFQATFVVDGWETRMMMTADSTWEVWTDIVTITKAHEREDRLAWDIFKLPHHCSYLSLSEEKGEDKTDPVPEVKWLMEKGTKHAIVVSTSKPIPTDDLDDQPPHRQAANYYKDRVAEIDGEFIVTMSHPSDKAPAPLVITIDGSGATVKKAIITGGAAAIRQVAPRAGRSRE